jgi:peptide/nickel transport system permease protein
VPGGPNEAPGGLEGLEPGAGIEEEGIEVRE